MHRMRTRFHVAMLAAFALATWASAADPLVTASRWEGFGVGSWVHHKKTSKMNIPGMSMPEEATEVRQTLVAVTEDAHSIRGEKRTAAGRESSGETSCSRRDAAKSPDDKSAPKAETVELGAEKVTVDGKAFDCKKARTVWGDTTTTTWTSKANGILKMEILSRAGGGRTTDVITVTAFARKVKFAGKDLVCRETTRLTKMEVPGVPSPGPGEGTIGVELTSDAVPGRRVRMEISGRRGPVTMSTLEELVAFEAKAP